MAIKVDALQAAADYLGTNAGDLRTQLQAGKTLGQVADATSGKSRDGMIDAIVCMRSWDLVWGLTYDVPCFVAVQTALARALDVEVGCYLHLAGSAHVYERHWATPTWDNWERGELEIPWLADSVAETQSNARAALDEMRTAAWLRA